MYKHKIELEAPIAKTVKSEYEIHGEIIIDEYAWLRDENWPDIKSAEVLKYIEEENLYYKQVSTHFKNQEQDLYNELVSREMLEDESVAIKKGDYYYYTRIKKGLDYPIYFRKHTGGVEEVIFNPNDLKQIYPNFRLGNVDVSPSHCYLLYSLDIDGSERFRVFVVNLVNKQICAETIEDTLGETVWDSASKGFFYVKVNEHWRPDEMYYHCLGTNQTEDKLIFNEEDALFWIEIKKSVSNKYLIIITSSLISSEIWLLDFQNMNKELRLIIPRKEGRLAKLNHINQKLYILTNDKNVNCRLLRLDENDEYREDLEDMIKYQQDAYLRDVYLYNSFFAIQYTIKGLACIDVFSYDLSFRHSIPFQDPTYSIAVINTPSESEGLVYEYSSLNTPKITYEYNFTTRSIAALKIDEIPKYIHSLYQSERLYAKSYDDKEIPISLVYRKDLFKSNGSSPLLLYGYGSYSLAVPSQFQPEVITLLDRGFVYAIAHIRGGDDLGYKWYEEGKFLKKKNTFLDFISCAEYLIENKYTNKGNIFIEGRSAGGLLVGFCINERPDLYRAAVANVPFVDVLNTMLDAALPLTQEDYAELGNPNEKKYFEYIKSYSPYENIKYQHYPALFMTAGINDPRVGYWEALKFVAKLRRYKTDNNLLLLDTSMESGHFGGGGKYQALKDTARVYNFILEVHDCKS